MASLDVSDAFDVSFLTTFYIGKPNKELDDEGVWQKTNIKYAPQIGVVVPDEESRPTGAVENEYIIKAIKVYIPHNLILHQNLIAPADIVYYNNQHYKVNEVKDYMNYGNGYCIARCHLQDASDQPEVSPA